MSTQRPLYKALPRDFSGGFLDTPETDTLPPNATSDAKNALLVSVETQDRTRAVMSKRLGCRLINPSVLATQKTVDGLFEFLRDNASGELLAVCNGTLSRYDNASGFGAITGGTGFTVGNTARMLPFRNNALLCDGVQNLRYDGSQCWPLGTDAPTSAPTLAAGTGTVTGTYEGYAVWYDSTADHESSPPLNSDGSLAVSSAVALVAQGRTWTKPSGSPSANYDKWRVYCRRTDTNERNYFRSAEVAIGTASVTETISDLGRTEIGPAPYDNDKPPAFALMGEWKGFRVGIKANSSDAYISKQYDAESQHPKNVFPIGGRGDSKPCRVAVKYGEEFLLQKPRRTYRLVGDRLPFQIVPVQSSLGGVSQDAGQEIRGFLYQWDEGVGPYRTNLSSWEPLADNRITKIVKTVSRLYLDQIRSAHVLAYNLMVWAVPTGATGRKSTLLAYNYVLNRWLPPITGFTFSSISEFTTTDGRLGVYFGDYYGRVYELFNGAIDGVPSGSTSGAITAATASTITASLATFYTSGNGLAGMPVAVKDPTGVWQWVRVLSNTGTIITLDTSNGPSLNPVPASNGTWTVYVGAIEWYWNVPKTDFGAPDQQKLGRHLYVQGKVSSASHLLEVAMRINGHLSAARSYSLSLPVDVDSGVLVWGVGQWGVDYWADATPQSMQRKRVTRAFFNAQFRFMNFYPNQPIVLTAWGLTADAMPGRSVPSA